MHFLLRECSPHAPYIAPHEAHLRHGARRDKGGASAHQRVLTAKGGWLLYWYYAQFPDAMFLEAAQFLSFWPGAINVGFQFTDYTCSKALRAMGLTSQKLCVQPAAPGVVEGRSPTTHCFTAHAYSLHLRREYTCISTSE